MARFFIDKAVEAGGEVLLDCGETGHAVSVFRVKKGDSIELFDGAGHRFLGTASDIRHGQLAVRITERSSIPFPSPVQISLAVGVFRPERMEMLVQKACELGASAILPLITDRSIVSLSPERWQSKIQKWQKIIQESCKQCGLAYSPLVQLPIPFKKMIPEIARYDLALIPTLETVTVPMVRALPSLPPKRILVFIGPEGDFSPLEVEMALKAGARSVSLGPLVLRSETAGFYALSAIHFFYREVCHA
jgi:16S rRNA (uracil1498-N3)-methyltransferase